MTIAHVTGVGTTRFGKQPNLSSSQLVWEAVEEALNDAGVTANEIGAVFLGTVFGEPGIAARALQGLGILGVPVVAVENACASGTTAFHLAQRAVMTDQYSHVLAVGVETMTALFDTAIEPMTSDAEGRQGFGMPAIYGMAATRYMSEYGLTREQLAQVAVKNLGNGLRNPRAQHQRSVSVDDVLASRPIADPLTLFQCCSIADAAAAAVISAKPTSSSVRIRASSLRSGGLWDSRSDLVWGWRLVHDTAAEAFEESGLTPKDVDVFEVHDAFTIGEIVTTEALGLCQLGGGGELVSSGHTSLGGPQPVNPSGGLLARGHPLGATGLAQIAEIVWQLRGTAAERQVDGAAIGLVETMGGGAAGVDGNACVVAVFGN